MAWPHIQRPMTPVPIQPIRVLPASALVSAMEVPHANSKFESRKHEWRDVHFVGSTFVTMLSYTPSSRQSLGRRVGIDMISSMSNPGSVVSIPAEGSGSDI